MDRDIKLEDAWLNVKDVKQIIIPLKEAIKCGIIKGSVRVHFNEYYNNKDELCYNFERLSYHQVPYYIKATSYLDLWSYFNLKKLYHDFMREFEYSLWHKRRNVE